MSVHTFSSILSNVNSRRTRVTRNSANFIKSEDKVDIVVDAIADKFGKDVITKAGLVDDD